MARRTQSSQNLLDMVPQKNPAHSWHTTKQGLVQIVIMRDGLMDRLVRRFKKTPQTLRVDLDEYGSFVWQAIDGTRDIHTIGAMAHDVWGAEVEPLYERLGSFIVQLDNNGLILLSCPGQAGA